MSPSWYAAAAATLVSFAAAASAASEPVAEAPLRPPRTKLAVPAAKLLLPLYVVDAENTATGRTTFFAVRNESETLTLDVEVRYFEAEEATTPQLAETVNLGPKATATFDVRSRLASLEVDADGFARGYVLFEAEGGAGVIHGDYFQVDDGGNFASGSRLVDADPDSRGNDLCTRFSIRFLNSQLLFDSGTVFVVWFAPPDPYEGNAFFYRVYDLAGNVVGGLTPLPSSRFAFEQPASGLLFNVDEEFGAIEFEFPFETEGHISAVMSAFDRFSVGFEATCLDAN